MTIKIYRIIEFTVIEQPVTPFSCYDEWSLQVQGNHSWKTIEIPGTGPSDKSDKRRIGCEIMIRFPCRHKVLR